MTDKQREQYLYQVVKQTIKWAPIQATEEDIWDLVMTVLMNIKEPTA